MGLWLKVTPSCVWMLSVDEFFSYNFYWIKREANMAAHSLAKFCISQELSTIYFPKNLPTLLEEAWFRDFRYSSVSV